MPNGYMQGSNGQLIEIIDAAARERLAKKLPAPETVTAGYYLRIKAVNADGTYTVEAVPEPSGSGAELPSTAKFETLAIGAADADGVYIESGGTADAPALDLYGEQGDERVRLRNLAEAVDDSDAPTLAQVRDMVGNGSGENVNGLTTAQINALDGMFNVCAYDDSKDIAGAYAAFKTAFNITDSGDGGDTTEKTLTSISAVYSGGSVAVGTAVSALTGVVVTATYDDGSTATVTDYILSGEIAEGENTITVTYEGLTATFTVTGVAESGGEDEEPVVLRGYQIPEVPDTNSGNDAFMYVTAGDFRTAIGGSNANPIIALKNKTFTGTVWVRYLAPNQSSNMGVPSIHVAKYQDLVSDPSVGVSDPGYQLTVAETTTRFTYTLDGIDHENEMLSVSQSGVLSSGHGSFGVVVLRFDIPDGYFGYFGFPTLKGPYVNWVDGWVTVFYENPTDHISCTEVTE